MRFLAYSLRHGCCCLICLLEFLRTQKLRGKKSASMRIFYPPPYVSARYRGLRLSPRCGEIEAQQVGNVFGWSSRTLVTITFLVNWGE